MLVPEGLVAGAAFLLLVSGPLGGVPRSLRPYLPGLVTLVVLVALVAELWMGGTLASLFGGGFVQDRFSVFVKAAALLAAGTAIAAADWSAEDSLSVGLAMPLLAVFGVMVAASAGDFVGLWAGLELAAAAGVVLVVGMVLAVGVAAAPGAGLVL